MNVETLKNAKNTSQLFGKIYFNQEEKDLFCVTYFIMHDQDNFVSTFLVGKVGKVGSVLDTVTSTVPGSSKKSKDKKVISLK